MTETIRVTPAEGRRVRKLDGSLLAESGETVADESYWRRRALDGDVAISAAPEAAAEAPAQARQTSRRDKV